MRSLERPTAARCGRVIGYSLAFSASLYILFGVLGALAWGTAAAADPLGENLPADRLSSLCRCCVILKVLVSYPLLYYGARLCVGQACLRDDITLPQHAWAFHLTTPLFYAATFALAIWVRQIDALGNLAASVGGTMQIFVWPGVLWIAIMYVRVDEADHHHELERAAGGLRRGSLVHLCLGSLVVVVGLGVAAGGLVGVVLTEL